MVVGGSLISCTSKSHSIFKLLSEVNGFEGSLENRVPSLEAAIQAAHPDILSRDIPIEYNSASTVGTNTNEVDGSHAANTMSRY